MPLPAVVDWRASGAVGPVKDQAVCGSCWSFSATQAMSSAWWLSTGEYISLSEQQVMDCSWDYGTNEACDGGDPDMAMLYVVENGGAYAEESWPYRGASSFGPPVYCTSALLCPCISNVNEALPSTCSVRQTCMT